MSSIVLTGRDGAPAAVDVATKDLLLGGSLVAATTLAYLALWWNRYFGPTLDGYFAHYGHLLLAGLIPYRDFYLHVPPLVPLESAALEALFGPHLIVPRLVGVLERTVIAVLGYLWLARLFSVRSAVLAALAMVIVGSGDNVEILFLYNHHAELWGLAAGLLASHALQRLRDGSRRWTWVLWLFAGASAGMAFLTKQTVGLGLFAALPVAVWLASGRTIPRARRLQAVAWVLFGWCLPVGAITTWLGVHRALVPAIDQLFVHGPSSKGPVAAVLLRALAGAWQIPSLRFPAAIALVTVAGLVVFALRHRVLPGAASGRSPWPVGVLVALALLAATLAAGRLDLGSGYLLLPQRSAVFLSLYGCLALSLFWGIAALRRELSAGEGQFLLVSFVAFSMGFMFATSWPSFEPIAIPGLGFMLCLVLADLRASRFETMLRAGVWACVALTVCFCTWMKLEAPFDFAGWVEPPVRAGVVEPSLPALRGFLVSPPTAAFVETATRLIEENSGPDEPIFVYPHLPVLYFLTDRVPPTFSMLHWFDVCSDEVTEADAEAVRARPPAMLVHFELTDEDYALHEAVFRDGRPSGQRKMRDVLHELESRYTLIATLPAGGSQVSIWKRSSEQFE